MEPLGYSKVRSEMWTAYVEHIHSRTVTPLFSTDSGHASLASSTFDMSKLANISFLMASSLVVGTF